VDMVEVAVAVVVTVAVATEVMVVVVAMAAVVAMVVVVVVEAMEVAMVVVAVEATVVVEATTKRFVLEPPVVLDYLPVFSAVTIFRPPTSPPLVSQESRSKHRPSCVEDLILETGFNLPRLNLKAFLLAFLKASRDIGVVC
jgi:hypothetical protein